MIIYSDVNSLINIKNSNDLVYNEYAINQSIANILGTVPGQRLFRPNFGCNLYYKLFEPISDNVALSIKSIVINAVEQWEPRVNSVKAKVFIDYSKQSYFINLDYNIIFLKQYAYFEFSLEKQNS